MAEIWRYDPCEARICGSVALIVLKVPSKSIEMTVLKAFGDRPDIGARLKVSDSQSVYELQVASSTCERVSGDRGETWMVDIPQTTKSIFPYGRSSS